MNATTKNVTRVSARNNPFAVQRTDAIPFNFSETLFENVDSFFQHVKHFRFQGAIVGKHGRGKTTLLCDLHSHLCQNEIDCELVFLPREKGLQLQSIKEIIEIGLGGAVVLIDGLERLSLFSRHHLISRSKSFGGIIATTHRPGRLRTLMRCVTSQHTLASVLESLGLCHPGIAESSKHLFARHRGNIRFVLRDLYDQFADGKLDIAEKATQSVL